MAILNIGSINWDRVYHVDRFPMPGETLRARRVTVGLGGKGLNHSVAIHRSGGSVRHLGAIAAQDHAMRQRIVSLGLTDDAIVRIDGVETGSALILVDAAGENQIVLDPGANQRIPLAAIAGAIDGLSPDVDWLLMQNETNGLADAVALAKRRRVKVALAAAPFDAANVVPVLDQLDLLAVNEIEYAQLCDVIGGIAALPLGLTLFVSYGAGGAKLITSGETIAAPAAKVTPVDTTGAGDTAFGAFLARIDLGAPPKRALQFAMACAGIQVTRPGAADAIPFFAEVFDRIDSDPA